MARRVLGEKTVVRLAPLLVQAALVVACSGDASTVAPQQSASAGTSSATVMIAGRGSPSGGNSAQTSTSSSAPSAGKPAPVVSTAPAAMGGTVAPPPAVAGSMAPVRPMTPAAAGSTASPAVPLTPHSDHTCLQAGSGSYGEPGPYKVGMMDIDLGMIADGQHTGKFTIFYPTPLETSCLHPIVAWGNGTTVMGSTTYAFFNNNAASWGMVVAASQEDNVGSGAFHKAGLDWLLKQNDDPSSMFYKKLSTRAGVAGHSQGGFGATQGTQHPNVEALVSVAGGGNPKKGVATLCLTGTMDMVEMPCTQEYQAATGPAFLGDWMNGDHTTTETIGGYIKKDPGTLQMQRLLAGWFRCWLADDQTACALFKGAPNDCGICKDMGWAKHEGRNL